MFSEIIKNEEYKTKIRSLMQDVLNGENAN